MILLQMWGLHIDKDYVLYYINNFMGWNIIIHILTNSIIINLLNIDMLILWSKLRAIPYIPYNNENPPYVEKKNILTDRLNYRYVLKIVSSMYNIWYNQCMPTYMYSQKIKYLMGQVLVSVFEKTKTN